MQCRSGTDNNQPKVATEEMMVLATAIETVMAIEMATVTATTKTLTPTIVHQLQ